MAEVWEAKDTTLDRRVAAKILYTHLAADPGFVARFKREAISSARLNHPAIVTVFDTGVDNDPRQHTQRAFIIMELVPGKTLRALITEGVVGLEDAVDIVAQAADGLSYAHSQGFVHRDVKPANIMVQPDGRVKVADFGIAKVIADGSDLDDLTQAGSILGTAKYLSPEQVDGTAVDARTDIYSLGVVLYEASVGKPPFVGTTDLATAMLHVNGTTQRPRQVRPEIPRMLEQVIVTAMSRDPRGRYQKASDMAKALRLVVDDDAVPAVTRTPADHTPPQGVGSPAKSGRSGATSGKPSAPNTDDEATELLHTDRTRVSPRPSNGKAAARSISTDPVGTSSRSRGRGAIGSIAALGVVGLVMGTVGGWSFGATTATPLQVREVRPFDPLPGDDRERNSLLPRLIDGTQAAWVTETYNSGFDGVSKRGVGVVFDLGDIKDLKTVQFATTTSGWSAEVYTADLVGDDLRSWGRRIARKDNIDTGTHTISVSGRGRLVMLWITDLGTDNANVSINELRVFG